MCQKSTSRCHKPGFDYDLGAGYDFGTRSPTFAFEAHLLGVSVADDPSRLGLTAGIGGRYLYADSQSGGGPSA